MIKRLGVLSMLVATGLGSSAASQSIAETLASQVRQPRASASDPKGIDLGPLEVQLWYEETGRLSENIAPPAEFVTWNTIIGEGQAAEIANDALFTVEVLSSGREENVDIPLVLTITNSAGSIIAQRSIDGVLTSEDGRSTKGLWAYGIGCAGDVAFSVTMGRIRRSVEVSFPCGE